ncbi:YezD family protein [Treponema sp.]|uniref:YezD family protein n=1 Tax=Treponema sp. TaxID=166 RepID=UPI0025E3C170|nr:YezD family protein [Treponema sp.]MBR4322226.1 YezD family protein [Treponema sp.]
MEKENIKNAAVVIKKSSSEEIKKVEELIKNIKFGSLTIHVEDAKIVQVDKNEKIRFR